MNRSSFPPPGPSRAPSIPPPPGQPVNKEDASTARAVDIFLLGFDKLKQDQQASKLSELKKNNPKLYTAVQGRLARMRTQEALTRLESSQASSSRIRTAEEARRSPPEILDRKNATEIRVGGVLKGVDKK